MASFTHKKLHNLPRDAMMQLLFATFLFSGTALAELRVWNRTTFTGQQGTLAAVSVLGGDPLTKQLSSCAKLGPPLISDRGATWYCSHSHGIEC